MGLETGTYVDDLISTNPIGGSDFLSEGDNHLRLIKSVLRNSFPGQTFPIGLVTDTGAANAYAGVMSPAPASLANGTIVMFRAVNANTGASTFNLNGLGAKAIVKYDGKALEVGDIAAGQLIMLQYESTSDHFEMVSNPGRQPFVEHEVNVASAASPDIWGATGPGSVIHITGTTDITDFADAPHAGAQRLVIFDGVLTLTDNANISNPGGSNIITAADDYAIIIAETTTTFKVIYFRADGSNIAAPPEASFQTGDIIYGFNSSRTGFLQVNGDTLGSGSSGATHAGTAFNDLFNYLWDNLADAQAPVSSGRGASAQADFDANKTITMPDFRGRSPLGAGTGSGLTARTVGDTGGEEDHQLTIAEMPSHNHTLPSNLQTTNAPAGPADTGVDASLNTSPTGSTGGDGAHNTMHPWGGVYWFIKL